MLGRTAGAVLVGVEARVIQIEVDLARGLPTIAAVGLPDSAVREGIDRVRSAIRHAGFKLPDGRIVINLAPAEVRKQGAALDLPIATAILVADGKIPARALERSVLVGELALDGRLRGVRGALAVALAARSAGFERLLLPAVNAEEAGIVDGLAVTPLGGIADLVAFAAGHPRPAVRVDVAELLAAAAARSDLDLADVRGQAAARRAIEVTAAGGHHLLLSGPPGAGKTMLARRLPGILPPLELQEALQVTRVWSVAGLSRGLVTTRPFRAPHHGVSFAGLTGGGARLRPGEITLASHGVLYLDELPEFRRDALEALRQPLEDGTITIVRVHGAATFPARFTLVASMNPCPCGYQGSPGDRCECTPAEVRRYRARLSGPLMDRFDLVIDVPPVDVGALTGSAAVETSTAIRGRVVAARRVQRRRFGSDGPECNARMGPGELQRWASLDPECRRMLDAACRRLGLSARGFDRVRRVARTLADLEGEERIGPGHVAEALQYRGPGSGASNDIDRDARFNG